MSNSPYYVTLSTRIPSWSGTRVGTFTRQHHVIGVDNTVLSVGTPNTSANYIVKIQTGTPSEAVTGEAIVAGTVTDTAIANGTITGTSIASNTVATGNIISGAVTGAKIASATITDTNITNGTITGSKIDSLLLQVVIWLMVLLQVLKLQTQPLLEVR